MLKNAFLYVTRKKLKSLVIFFCGANNGGTRND